jgi:hypothetical protein
LSKKIYRQIIYKEMAISQNIEIMPPILDRTFGGTCCELHPCVEKYKKENALLSNIMATINL